MSTFLTFYFFEFLRFHQTSRDQSHSHTHHRESQLPLQRAHHHTHHHLNQHGHHQLPLLKHPSLPQHHLLQPLQSRLDQLKVFIEVFIELFYIHFYSPTRALYLPLYPHTNNFLSITLL